MARLTLRHFALHQIMVSALFMLCPEASAAGSGLSDAGTGLVTSPPKGFEDLAAERQLVVDAYVGGQKAGEVRVTLVPGSLSFDRPDLVAAMVPQATDPAGLARLLAGPLSTNVPLACGLERRDGCGVLRPDRAGIIFDEARFRVDIFVHPDLLARPDPQLATYLPEPDNSPSLISQFGATVSGASRGNGSWHAQNHSIASIGRVRLSSDSSLSSESGLTFDNFALEADREDRRFIGGLFWAPGTDLIGRRRVVGVGISTQFETRLDRTTMMATPLIIFLQQSGRVDLLVDGRIQSSHIYPAGNRQLDTANLPNGSYEILIRVQEDGQPAREERQFFSKGAPIAPAGRPLLSAFAGLLPAAGEGGSMRKPTPYYQATAAFRLGPSWGVDAALVGTDHKAIFEGGVILLSRLAQVRAGALISSSADHGLVLRASSVGHGPLSFSLDLRKIHSRDGRALLPVTASSGTFSEDTAPGFADGGSYTQILSIFGRRIGSAIVRFTGLYRRGGSGRPTYSLGVAGELPVVRSERWNFVLQGDVRKTETGVSSFMGFRLLASRGRLAYSGSAGVSHRSGSPDRSTRPVGEAQASWFHQQYERQYSANVALGRDLEGSYGRASAAARLPMINARADLLHQAADDGATTQYSATVDTGLVLGGGRLGVAARERNDAAIMVHVAGGDPQGYFDVLVDEVVRSTLRGGDRLPVFLEPFRHYEVRLRPVGGLIANVDPAQREVTLFPGSVVGLEWAAKSLFILFGRALDAQGLPLANADITWPNGVGRSDSDGYFQIEAGAGDEVRFSHKDGVVCAIGVRPERPASGYIAGGDMICR